MPMITSDKHHTARAAAPRAVSPQTDDLWAELSLLAVVTLILIVLAWGYVW